MYETPKIDWTSEDYINYEDFNRIINNINTINCLIGYFKNIKILKEDIESINMKTIPFAFFFNEIEESIKELSQNGYLNIEFEEPKTDWISNEPISYKDINRIERNIKILYEYYRYNIDSIPKCGMVLAGEKLLR